MEIGRQFMDFWRCIGNDVILQRSYYYGHHRSDSVTVRSNLMLLLLENLLHTSPSPGPNRGPCSPRGTTRRRNSSEHSPIQKDSLYCTLHANNITCLLPSIRHSCSLACCYRRVSQYRLGCSLVSYFL